MSGEKSLQPEEQELGKADSVKSKKRKKKTTGSWWSNAKLGTKLFVVFGIIMALNAGTIGIY